MKKYLQAIVAGVIGGVILAILSFLGSIVFMLIFPWEMARLIFAVAINLVYNPYPPMNLSDVLLPCVIAFSLLGIAAITFFATGLLAAKFASRNVSNILDSIVLGVTAGLIAEIILIPSAIFFKLTGLLLIKSYTIFASDFFGIPIWAIVTVLTLVLGTLLAVAGALCYYVIAKKNTSDK